MSHAETLVHDAAPPAAPTKAWTSQPAPGLSMEARRLAAGMRLVVSLLAPLLLVVGEPRVGLPTLIVLAAYTTWAIHVLRRVAAGQDRPGALNCYRIDIAWSIAVVHTFGTGSAVMALTMVQPIVLASIGFGARHGAALAALGAVGLLADQAGVVTGGAVDWRDLAPAVGVLALVPLSAALSRPLSVLRWRLASLGNAGAALDPRRGLAAVSLGLVERVRAATQAHAAALVLSPSSGAPAVLASADDGAFRAGDAVQRRLVALMGAMPVDGIVSHARRRWHWLGADTRVHGRSPMTATIRSAMQELADLLEVQAVLVVPLQRHDRQHGHLIVGHRARGAAAHDVDALSQAAPDVVQLIEQAALVDQLQEESAAHERARIGRDLHDSAIQPYLGLKYAVECVALRIPHDNPARAEVDSLAELVNAEVAALRELISGLRTGGGKGDNALVSAVRRQARRFGLLFGLEVWLNCPDALPTSRALAGALFHMVNEALNNVRKHTTARRIWITLSTAGNTMRLVVRDDGATAAGRPAPDFLPRSLSERAAEMGGTLHIGRPDGLNTEVTITIPI